MNRISKTFTVTLLSLLFLALVSQACDDKTNTEPDPGTELQAVPKTGPDDPGKFKVAPDPTAYSSPIPESEMVTIVFSRAWIKANDESSNPDAINVTFPASWVTDPPAVEPPDTPLTLHIPQRMFESLDTDPDPDTIRASLPIEFFEELPMPHERRQEHFQDYSE